MAITNGQDILDRAGSIRGDNSLDITYQKNRSLLTGGLIGAAGGAYFGYAKKQNLLVTGLLGAVVGMIIAGAFIPR
jgi:hypothetical protein